MQAGTFYFNGESCTSYGIRVQHQPDLEASTRRFNSYTVSGRHGTLYQLKSDRLEGVPIILDCVFLDTNVWATRDAIVDWLDTIDYVPFVPWWDDDYEYRAIVVEQPTFKHTRLMKQATTFELSLILYPLKYLRTGLLPIELKSGEAIYNPFKVPAQPLIELTGNGSITVTVAGINYELQEVKGHATIDSELLESTAPMVGYVYPELPFGQTVITYTGADSMRITPRLARKVG